KFDPSSAEKWVQFDEKSRKLIGNPTEDANKNTTVLLHISDPAGGSTDTTMNILVSNCVGEKCIKHVPREILAVAVTLSAAFGLCLLITFGFILFKKYRRMNEKKSKHKQTNEVFSVESDNEREYNDQRSRENMRIYSEKEIRSQVAMYNFQNVAITDATRLETSFNSEISNVGARMPWKIEGETSSTDVSLANNRKIIHKESSGSSLYSYSSAAASCDNISQSMTLSGIKRMEVPENCVSNIPVIYATPGSSFIYQVEYPLPSLTHYGLQEFMAVTDPDDGPIP
ncbi:8000_t:CDS:1, partial [Acaulospora morrowiae]